MPSGAEVFSQSGSYADPARYRFVPASAVIEDVPIRATLKQFEGRWSGHLRRTVDADIAVYLASGAEGKRAPKIREGSTITNNLGHALTNCYLIQSWENAFRPSGLQNQLRAEWILVHPLGSIADAEQIDVAQRTYTNPDTGTEHPLEKWSTERTLKEFHDEWAKDFRSALGMLGGGSEVVDVRLDQYQNALLMLTTLSAHNPITLQTSFSPAGFDFWRHPCRQLDRCDELTTDRMMLIGFAEDQGPVTLCTRTGSGSFRPLRAEQAYTMYRFSIPVTWE
jgi:hypothetical protein